VTLTLQQSAPYFFKDSDRNFTQIVNQKVKHIILKPKFYQIVTYIESYITSNSCRQIDNAKYTSKQFSQNYFPLPEESFIKRVLSLPGRGVDQGIVPEQT